MVNVLTCAHILLAGSLLNPEYIDCHLWKRITDVTGQKICVYRGKNSVMAYHYVTDNGSLNQWSQCPKTIRCVTTRRTNVRRSLRSWTRSKEISDG